jgi:hypothetical protein
VTEKELEIILKQAGILDRVADTVEVSPSSFEKGLGETSAATTTDMATSTSQ